MGSKTGIEWTDATWNPILGCSRVSEGCRNCYAESIAGRFGRGKDGNIQPTVYAGLTQITNGRPVWTGKIVETLQLLKPLTWRKPKRVFVNSMSDLFHENVTDEQRDRIFAVMALCPQHIFQVLTKRPDRMLAYFRMIGEEKDIQRWINAAYDADPNLSPCAAGAMEDLDYPLPNVWLGVSAENQTTANERIPPLLKTPAARRFISAEPLLGPVQLLSEHDGWGGDDEAPLTGGHPTQADIDGPRGMHFIRHGTSRLDWVICGGESGSHARPMHPDWARSLRNQCAAVGVPFFFKQWGEWMDGSDFRKSARIVLNDGRVIPSPDTVDQETRNRWNDFNPCMMAPVGKKAAGHQLDGREWRQFPGQSLVPTSPVPESPHV